MCLHVFKAGCLLTFMAISRYLLKLGYLLYLNKYGNCKPGNY